MRAAEARIVEFVRYSDGCERAELAAALDLPEPTVSSAVRRLLASGGLEAVPATARSGAPGRPRSAVRVPGARAAIGLISWEPDRIVLRLLGCSGAVLHRVDLPRSAPVLDADGLVEPIRRVLALSEGAADHVAVAVVLAVPAPFLQRHGTPLEHADAGPRRFAVAAPADLEPALSARFGLPVVMENDTNLAALGEQHAGGVDAEDFLYVKLNGHAFGGGLVVGGRLVRGARGYAGELAHLQTDPSGPACQCGGRGCLWMAVRGVSVTAAQGEQPVLVAFADLPARSAAGDPGATRLLRDIGGTLGRPLAQLCTLLDPQKIVVDTAIGPEVRHVLRGIRERFATDTPPAIGDNVQLVESRLGDTAELHGAVELLREPARIG
jgi:predicted NBD/HSP70 family sugar kinase